MALKIRLRRMGRKKAPTYRIVVAESSMPRDGRFVANLGHYNPRTEPMTLVVDREKTLGWLEQGATATDTVNSLLKRAGVFKEPSVIETAVEAVKDAAEEVVNTVKETAGDVAAAVSGDEEK
jgi:small subunit ribosomal protein S16